MAAVIIQALCGISRTRAVILAAKAPCVLIAKQATAIMERIIVRVHGCALAHSSVLRNCERRKTL